MSFMQVVVFMGSFTIWITSIIFVSSLLSAIEAIHKDKPYGTATLVCAISFLMTVAPIMVGISLLTVGDLSYLR